MPRDRKAIFWERLKLNRECAVTLSAQLADAIREAVDDGILNPGDVLPSQLELAERLGTSARVPREAFAELAAARIVTVRPRIGCVVLPRRAAAKRGRVLFVVRESMAIGFYVTVFENALRSLVVRKGFTFVKAVLGSRRGSRGEYTELEDALSHSNVLGVAFDEEEETFRRIRAACAWQGAGRFGDGRLPGCRGVGSPAIRQRSSWSRTAMPSVST